MMHEGETSTYALKPIWRLETALLNNGKHLHVIIKHIPCVKNIVPVV